MNIALGEAQRQEAFGEAVVLAGSGLRRGALALALRHWPTCGGRWGVRQCSVPEAMQYCRHEWMREALRILVARRGWELPPGVGLHPSGAGAAGALVNGHGSAADSAPAAPEPANVTATSRVLAQS